MGLMGPIGLIGLMVFSACSSEQQEGEGAMQQRPVDMFVYTSQLSTRADSSILAEPAIPMGMSIGVYAYYHDNSTWAVEDAAEPKRTLPNFMFNQQAVNPGSDQPYTYSPLKYWPNEEEDKLSFIAYYPYCNGTADDGSEHDIETTGITPLMHDLGALIEYGSGLPPFRFAVKDNVKEQVDFLVSDLIPDLPHSRALEPNPSDPFNNLTITDRVRFYFWHALSKVEFRVVIDESIRRHVSYFTLNSIGITNIYNEAHLTPTYDSGTGNTSLVWSDHRDSHKTDYACKTTEAYLLLPQELRNDAMLNISYDLTFESEGTVYVYDGSGNPVAVDEYLYGNHDVSIQLNTLKISGSEDPLDEWLPNHHYVYTIRLCANRIEFTGQVAEWGEIIWQPI